MSEGKFIIGEDELRYKQQLKQLNDKINPQTFTDAEIEAIKQRVSAQRGHIKRWTDVLEG